MKELTLRTKKLNNLDSMLIGNGGNSRLDIMLDLKSGEIWEDEFLSHEVNSWKKYRNKNIVCVGRATNSIVVDEESKKPKGYGWNVTIWEQWKNTLWGQKEPEEINIVGDCLNNSYDIKDVLSAIKQFYGELE